ncbi:MAG TPA: hypothetical protein VIR04_00130 [Paralcaligenes sp.]
MFVSGLPEGLFNTDARYGMGYSKFIQELNKGIEGQITAYSRKDNEEGCLIYLRSPEQRIFVTADVMNHRRDESIQVLRAKIREGVKSTPVLVLKLRGNDLVFEKDIIVQESRAAEF